MTANKDRTLVVHKEGAEGTLLVDYMTGKILTPIDEKPDWAQGLAACLPQERITFYLHRFGTEGKEIEAIKNADAVAMQDLSWVGVDANQEATELEADLDYRLELVGKLLDIDTETGAVPGTTQERELVMTNTRRTAEEQHTLEVAMNQGFPEVASEQGSKTGTHD